MFTTEKFIEACRAANRGSGSAPATHELVAEAVATPGTVEMALGGPKHAGFEVLWRSPTLTILDFAWAPWMCFKPHNHCMWSVVGIYAGREDNMFWRRTEASIEAAGARSLGAGDVAVLGADIIHSVTNPLAKWTRAIHVYGGDFFAPPVPRSEWDHETLLERPWDMADTRRLFTEAEARSACTGASPARASHRE